MVKFNKSLVNDMIEPNLAKLVLFCIDQGISIEAVVDIKEEKLRAYQGMFLTMIERDIISRTVEPNSMIPYKLNHPLFVKDNNTFQHDIQEYMHYFYKAVCGTLNLNSVRSTVLTAMTNFMKINNDYSWQDIISATDDMSNEYKGTIYHPNAYNFIVKTSGVCLISFLEANRYGKKDSKKSKLM